MNDKLLKSLKIGLDYHGVINKYPHYFHQFCKCALERGHRIYILTGGPKLQIIKKLKKDNIKYTALFTIIDYYLARQKALCSVQGHFHIDKKLWDTAKAAFCYQHKINIQIDDSGIYGKYFTTPYCRYESAEQKCHLNRKKIIWLQSPEDVLTELESYLFFK